MMRHGWWKLDAEKNPVYVGAGVEALKQLNFDDADARRVGLDLIEDVRVSTVFLALDHNYSEFGPPLLFETMVFRGESGSDMACSRYPTWNQAMAGHEVYVKAIYLLQAKGQMADAERFASFLEAVQTRIGELQASGPAWKQIETSSDSEEETKDEA